VSNTSPDVPLRVGLVGAGAHAHRNILPTLGMLDVELVAVADMDSDRARETARRHGAAHSFGSAEEMYASGEIDAALLVVSPTLHPTLAIQAFEAGLDVWSEKPAAAASSQVREMLEHRGDQVCVVGYKKAFMPSAVKARELLPTGPRSASAVYPVSLPLGEGEAPYPVSDWLTSGCHPLSLLVSVVGPVARVTAYRPPHGGGVVVLERRSGAVSTLHASLGAPKFQPCERYLFAADDGAVEIINTRKVIHRRPFWPDYNSDDNFAPVGQEGGSLVWEAQDTMATLQGKNVVTQGIYGGLHAFVEAARTRRAPEVGTLEFALEVTKVYEAALRSNGNPVEVDAA